MYQEVYAKVAEMIALEKNAGISSDCDVQMKEDAAQAELE